MRHGLMLLALIPLGADAATSYVVTNKLLSPPRIESSVAQYVVQGSAVRAADLDARIIYLFEDGKAFVIDHASKAIEVVTSATVARAADRMDERVAAVKDAAAKLPADKRAVLDKMAADMQALNDSRRVAVPREYRVTARSESVDGHACRIWEVFEYQTKRFEFCVAPMPAIAGSAELLKGMHVLSGYWQGSIFALGVKLGNTGWWREIADLRGLPILIREFNGGSAISETTLTSIHSAIRVASMFELPRGYARTEVAAIP